MGEDIGLTVKLQQKLKEEQRDRERLERKLEELENGAEKGQQKTGDTIRVSGRMSFAECRAPVIIICFFVAPRAGG